MSVSLYKFGPDNEEYYFPLNEIGEVGNYGYREGEMTGVYDGNTTSAFYITDGNCVWRCEGIMYMEIPESEFDLQETLDAWLEYDDPKLVFGEE